MNTAKTKANKATASQPTQITLLKPHTHEGQDYEAGASIEVDETTAAWLYQNGVAAQPEASAEKA